MSGPFPWQGRHAPRWRLPLPAAELDPNKDYEPVVGTIDLGPRQVGSSVS
jgi:hypothetical protein